MILVEANAWFNNAIRAYGPSPGGWLAFPASLGQRVTDKPGLRVFYRWMMEITVRALLGAAPAGVRVRGNVRFSSWRVVGYEEINDPSGQTAAAMSVTATYAAGTTTSCVVTASRSTRFLESARAQHPRAIAWLTVNIGFPSGQANLEFMAVEIPSDDGRTVSALNVQARPLPSPAPSPTGRPRSASARR